MTRHSDRLRTSRSYRRKPVSNSGFGACRWIPACAGMTPLRICKPSVSSGITLIPQSPAPEAVGTKVCGRFHQILDFREAGPRPPLRLNGLQPRHDAPGASLHVASAGARTPAAKRAAQTPEAQPVRAEAQGPVQVPLQVPVRVPGAVGHPFRWRLSPGLSRHVSPFMRKWGVGVRQAVRAECCVIPAKAGIQRSLSAARDQAGTRKPSRRAGPARFKGNGAPGSANLLASAYPKSRGGRLAARHSERLIGGRPSFDPGRCPVSTRQHVNLCVWQGLVMAPGGTPPPPKSVLVMRARASRQGTPAGAAPRPASRTPSRQRPLIGRGEGRIRQVFGVGDKVGVRRDEWLR
ncbi:hypothetical protein A7A08_00552 [Methyloligella halotolerans]|uniref:Uncharacterized protein n=1 Tax=Methyloligella halotolerans TaxID=1177755 RepID=A0A1E2S2V4_9HYPH|nr:hypothetical protein A7A08_00552 [Methyloligella halotolerans]